MSKNEAEYEDFQMNPVRSEPGSKDIRKADLVTKAAAARILEISLSEFKRREKAGVYVPSEMHGEVRYYSRAYLERRKIETGRRLSRVNYDFQREKSLPGPKGEPVRALPPASLTQFDYDPNTAKAIYRELRKDENLVRIVEELGIHPSIVTNVHQDWVKLRNLGGGFHVSSESMKTINDLGLDGFPISSEEELVMAMTAYASTLEPCTECEQRPRRAATRCVPCEKAFLEHHLTQKAKADPK